MATADTAARNSRASAFSADYATATLTILGGATVLAVHTLTGFSAPATGVITASAIADTTITSTGTADGATFTDAAGSYALTVGLTGSGSDVEYGSLSFILGKTASISSGTVDFPA